MQEKVKSVLLSAAGKAGALMKERFDGPFKIENKEGRNNLVTEVDLACEKVIVDEIRAHFPDHSILGEEGGGSGENADCRWIIDPIDGTTNFARGIPLFVVSIGWERNGEVEAGVVFNPVMEELYFAQRGQGAWRNDQPIQVSGHDKLETSFLVTGFPYHWPKEEGNGPMDVFADLVQDGVPVRRLGSAALDLCWVACGRFEGFWEYNLQPWDIAAGYLMVEEAGGKVTNFLGARGKVSDKQTLATNGHIHEALRQRIAVHLRNSGSTTK